MNALHLARPEHLDRLTTLGLAFAEEMNLPVDEAQRRAALMPLLDGSPYGMVYLIGPTRAPVGYVAIVMSYSLEFGGMDAMIDEFYIRPAVRGRGMATEVLQSLPKALCDAGVAAMSLEVDREDEATQRLYTKAGFKPRDRFMLMSRDL